MFNYKAPRLRITYNLSVVTPSSTGIAGTFSTKHQIWAKPSTIPTPGTPTTEIVVLRRDGSTRTLADWIQNYAAEAIRPRYRLQGGSAYGDMIFGLVDVDYLPENSDDATWIAAQSIDVTGFVQPAGANHYATQLMVTFRTAGGRTAKLNYMHGRSGIGSSIRIPTSDTGIQSFVNYCVASSSCLRGLDGTPFIAGMSWNPGQNEALWKKQYRR